MTNQAKDIRMDAEILFNAAQRLARRGRATDSARLRAKGRDLLAAANLTRFPSHPLMTDVEVARITAAMATQGAL